MSVWFKSRLNPWYIWIPSNPNLYSTKIIMKMRWQTIASNVSIRTISPTATPLPKAYDCVAVYIAGRRTSLVVYGWWPQPPTKKCSVNVVLWMLCNLHYQTDKVSYLQITAIDHFGLCDFYVTRIHKILCLTVDTLTFLSCLFYKQYLEFASHQMIKLIHSI